MGIIGRVWWGFALVWAVFSLLWGPLEGPDTVKDRIFHALVPVILWAVCAPLLRMLNFRRVYREHGRDGVIGLAIVWLFVLTLFFGRFITDPLGWHRVSNALVWLMMFFCAGLPALMFLWWMFVKLPFMALRWLARLLFPGLVDAGSRYIRSLLPSRSPSSPARTSGD